MADLTTVVNVIASAYTDSTTPDANYQGASLPMYTASDIYGAARKDVVLVFNPADLPQGRRIKTLYLQMYVASKSGAASALQIDAPANTITAASIGGVTHNSLTPAQELKGYSNFTSSAVVGAYTNFDIAAIGTYMGFPLLVFSRGIMLRLIGASTPSQLNIQSQTGANPPRISLITEDVPITASNLFPASGFVDRTKATAFSWGVSYSATNVLGTVTAASAKFRWRVKDAGTYTEINVAGASHTLPANTLSDGIYEWQVEVTTNAGTIATSSWMEITTVDAAAVATPVSPKSVYINGEEINTFTWSHSTTTGTLATRSDLQCSTNGSSWTDLATVTGNALTTTIPANTFSAGRLYWRVRTYNSNGIAGAWSTAVECYVLAPVPVPTISSVTSGTARPTFTWTATTQNAFELDILQSGVATIKSGVIVSTDKSYKLGGFLPDGDYTAQLRVYDSNGNYSEWATYEFAVTTAKPTTPTLSAAQSGNDVMLTVSGAESTCYLLRDGQPIAKIQGVYTDAKTALEHTYTARNVSPADTYSDSAEVSASPNVKGYVLSNSVGTVNLKFRTSITDDFSNIGSSAHYTGAEFADFEFSEFSDNSFNLGFAIPRKSQPDLDTLEKIIKAKELTFVKSNYGDEMYCKITGYSKNPTKHQTEVTISLVRVNHSEVIAYD